MAPNAKPTWAQRLHDSLARIAGAGAEHRDALIAEVWPLLRTAVLIKARHHAARYVSVDMEILEDLASEKALDLLLRAVSGRWNVTSHTPGELASFISTSARNALVDTLRKEGRNAHPDAIDDGPGWDAPAYRRPIPGASHLEKTGEKAEREEYARDIADCVGGLTDAARTVWFLRVMLDMSSRDIAEHPEVGKTPGNVDVILQRARAFMTECMEGKGHDPKRMPQGTFTAIWERFRGLLPGNREEANDD